MTNPSIEQLLENVKSGNPQAMMETEEALLKIVKDSLGEIMAAFENTTTLGKAVILPVLGETGNEKAIPLLQKALYDENISIRIKAAQSLAQLGKKDGIAILITALKSDEIFIGHPPELASDYAAQLLRSLTDQHFGFDPDDEKIEQLNAIKKWEEWWELNKDDFKF